MLKDIGRLDIKGMREIDAQVDGMFELLDKDQVEKAQKKLFEIAKSPNYFIREYLGKSLLRYKDLSITDKLAAEMLENKFYGIRATALFYNYNRFFDDPDKVLDIIQQTYESTPWETESIINELWKRFPDQMKRDMLTWLKDENEKKRALAFHGMENLAEQDPFFVMEFIGNVIDDESVEVQKKITHILTQVARTRPAECYPFIREWLLTANDSRQKTLWVSMKKLANILMQKSKRDKSEEFILLTTQTISDWRNDEHPGVAEVGAKLFGILQRNDIEDDG